MPLRQSTLKFSNEPVTASHKKKSTDNLRATIPHHNLTPPAEDVEMDTIIVNTSKVSRRTQLPTPSESATDVSSQASSTPNSKRVRPSPRSRTKRVSATHKKADRDRDISLSVPEGNDKQRNISGETLVEEDTIGNETLLKNGIEALDLTWNMSTIFNKEIATSEIEEEQSNDGSTIEVAVDDAAVEEQQHQRDAKRAKIAENQKKWEQRRKEAEKDATRRSKRASGFLEKASTVVSGITASVLGKRTRDTNAKDNEQEKTQKSTSQEGRDTKKVHIDASHKSADNNSLSSTVRAIRSRAAKDKKWLSSGLYAGQASTFNPAVTEAKNKRKSTVGPAEEQATSTVRENTVLPMPMFAGARLLSTGRDFKLPFDVFSPLAGGEPKPDEWKKVNRSVFIGDAVDQWRWNLDWLEHSTCVCKASTGCDHNCMNRFMYYECDRRNCNLTEEECGNRAFEALRQRREKGGKYNVGVEVIKTSDRGYGVRSNRTFEPNQIIVEYTGEIITQEECESRMRGVYKDNECYYLMAFDQNMIIDATRGSIARFVNHSCDPNCRMEKWTVGNKPRMALFAGDRGIMTGEELTYDYNFDPYSQKNVQTCRCGSDNCRGVLGPKPKDAHKRASPAEGGEKQSKVKSVKRKITEVLEENNLLPKNNKKRRTTEPISRAAAAPTSKGKARSSTDGGLNRQPSKLQRLSNEKSRQSPRKTAFNPKARGNPRTVSTGSRTALITRAEDEELSHDEENKSSIASLKAKAENIRQNVRKTLRSNR